jgi:DNA-binding YbaB/EbfC family protein
MYDKGIRAGDTKSGGKLRHLAGWEGGLAPALLSHWRKAHHPLHLRRMKVRMNDVPTIKLSPSAKERLRAMKFPGGLNIQQMMKQAQQMQEKMAKEMEELVVEASAGGGVVTVQMKGTHEVTGLKIDPEAVKEDDIEMLQDMILAAINEANRKIDEAMKGKLGGMLPPGLGGML